VRCAAITRAGERCKAEATQGSYCWNHAPEKAEARKQRARRGGRSGGNGRSSGLSETAVAKRWIKGPCFPAPAREVERDTATAAFMGINVLPATSSLSARSGNRGVGGAHRGVGTPGRRRSSNVATMRDRLDRLERRVRPPHEMPPGMDLLLKLMGNARAELDEGGSWSR
jgi:hypothetical protein